MAKGRQHQAKPHAPKASSDRMTKAWALFDGGDKVSARRQAEAVLAQSPTEEEAREAQDLISRLKIPRDAFIFAAIAAAVLVVLVALAIFRYQR